MMAAAGAFIKQENVDPDLVPALAPALAPDLVPMVIINNVNIKQEVNVENSEIQERMDDKEGVEYRSEIVNVNSNAYVNCNGGVVIKWPQPTRVCQKTKMREIKPGISQNGNPIKCITRSEVEQRLRRQRGKVAVAARYNDASLTNCVIINGKIYKKLNVSTNRNLVHRNAIRKKKDGEYNKENVLPIIASVRGNADIVNMQAFCSTSTPAKGSVRNIPIVLPGSVRNAHGLHQGTVRNAPALHQGTIRNAHGLHKGTRRNAQILHQDNIMNSSILHQGIVRNSLILPTGTVRNVPHLPFNSTAFCHKCPTCKTYFASAQRYL